MIGIFSVFPNFMVATLYYGMSFGYGVGIEAYPFQKIIRKLRAPNPPHAIIIVGSIWKVFISCRVCWVSDGMFLGGLL